jgi:hypothetical protein
MCEQEPCLEQPQTEGFSFPGVQRQVAVDGHEPPDDGLGRPFEALLEDSVALDTTGKFDSFQGSLCPNGDIVTLRFRMAVHVARIWTFALGERVEEPRGPNVLARGRGRSSAAKSAHVAFELSGHRSSLPCEVFPLEPGSEFE